MIDSNKLQELIKAKEILDQQNAQNQQSEVASQEASAETYISQGFESTLFTTPFEQTS